MLKQSCSERRGTVHIANTIARCLVGIHSCPQCHGYVPHSNYTLLQEKLSRLSELFLKIDEIKAFMTEKDAKKESLKPVLKEELDTQQVFYLHVI